MNSKTAQLRENGTEIVRLFARFALGVCRSGAYLIQKTSALVLEIKYKAMPMQPSLGYDRLFAIWARGGL
jgi:hypothetical protein